VRERIDMSFYYLCGDEFGQSRKWRQEGRCLIKCALDAYYKIEDYEDSTCQYFFMVR
jgi:hypothetical protein